jgi:hypothetical protein
MPRMTDALHDVMILVPGRLHEQAARRIEKSFNMVPIERADAAPASATTRWMPNMPLRAA